MFSERNRRSLRSNNRSRANLHSYERKLERRRVDSSNCRGLGRVTYRAPPRIVLCMTPVERQVCLIVLAQSSTAPERSFRRNLHQTMRPECQPPRPAREDRFGTSRNQRERERERARESGVISLKIDSHFFENNYLLKQVKCCAMIAKYIAKVPSSAPENVIV